MSQNKGESIAESIESCLERLLGAMDQATMPFGDASRVMAYSDRIRALCVQVAELGKVEDSK